MNILDAIRERRSVRSFDGTSLTAEERELLNEAVSVAESPFGGNVEIRLREFDLRAGFRPGTYGFIRGAVDFFLIAVAPDETSALSAGFRFEQVVLKAQELGLGTCWIGGTFRESDFNSGESWPEGETLTAVCPVGHPAPRRFLEKVMRMTAGSDRRKPFGELFYSEGGKRPLSQESRFGESLEMMRLAPSSVNSQPWRAIVACEGVHFYCKPKNKFSQIDCGIGLCHFYLAEKFRGETGKFQPDEGAPAPPSGWKYITTYRRLPG